MSEAPAAVTLDTPIKRGDTEIAEITIRKPTAGELRGLSLVDLTQLDVNAMLKLLPRISTPLITDAEAAKLDPADLLALATEVASFLPQRSKASSGSRPA